MAGTKKSSNNKKRGKYPDQFRRTTNRTGKWRGKQADKYIKYIKIKREKPLTCRFEAYRGYVSLNRQGEPVYTLVKRSGMNRLILTKIFNKNKKNHV